MKRTKGPWYVGDRNGKQIVFGCVDDPRSHETVVVALVHHDRPDRTIGDAHLIAAAPEMLATLKLVADWLEAQGGADCLDHAGLALSKKVDAALAGVIPKAEGRSE